ncbi:protocatechuate 4,5-dioxygenase subunit alpha [Candidatus Poriferisodalis sp.]|uniref:protocatechuate 4,5-dioxygenase subunit alpha n=1 Tax=Candidatus Poriferisodalis sp. TaxID=3101277 RepID=UPI003AF4CEFE
MPLDKPYLDVPGTTIFDTEQARRGYWLNQFCMSLMSEANRERFRADERAYVEEWNMSDEQKTGVLDRDFNRLIGLGGNIYFLAKIGATDGLSFVQIVSSMTENDEEGHKAMMLAGGRSPDGNRYLSEWEAQE